MSSNRKILQKIRHLEEWKGKRWVIQGKKAFSLTQVKVGCLCRVAKTAVEISSLSGQKTELEEISHWKKQSHREKGLREYSKHCINSAQISHPHFKPQDKRTELILELLPKSLSLNDLLLTSRWQRFQSIYYKCIQDGEQRGEKMNRIQDLWDNIKTSITCNSLQSKLPVNSNQNL